MVIRNQQVTRSSRVAGSNHFNDLETLQVFLLKPWLPHGYHAARSALPSNEAFLAALDSSAFLVGACVARRRHGALVEES